MLQKTIHKGPFQMLFPPHKFLSSFPKSTFFALQTLFAGIAVFGKQRKVQLIKGKTLKLLCEPDAIERNFKLTKFRLKRLRFPYY